MVPTNEQIILYLIGKADDELRLKFRKSSPRGWADYARVFQNGFYFLDKDLEERVKNAFESGKLTLSNFNRIFHCHDCYVDDDKRLNEEILSFRNDLTEYLNKKDNLDEITKEAAKDMANKTLNLKYGEKNMLPSDVLKEYPSLSAEYDEMYKSFYVLVSEMLNK